MRTELRDDEFSEVYAEFTALLPEKPWIKRVSNLQHQINEMPIRQPFLWKQNILAYGLAAFDSHGKSTDPEVWNAIKQAMIFASQIVKICRESPPANARNLCRRVSHALNKPDGARGLRFELMVATHLSRKGCGITWMEEHSGEETFDMLATISDVESVEVECKSLSVDKGESLTEGEFYELINCLMPLIEPKLPDLERHLYGISFTFNGMIPKSAPERVKLVSELVEAIDAGEHGVEGVCAIDLRLVNLQSLEYDLTQDELNILASELLGSDTGYRLVKNLGAQGYLAIDVKNLVPSKFDSALNKVAKHVVRKQMTGKRPGCLVIRVERHSKATLEAFAADERNLLARRATKFLCNPGYEHLAAVVFVSAPSLEIMSESSESEQSRTYVFESQLAQHQRLGIGRIFGVEE
ncbi:hypothetical protein [Pectobacterium brasiliense]|uniref:hypothetical protein n=1 Tax=Pectobacterium brasiliense TaxID=180957 RepID=UPI00196982AC|nr:hypothetical protein [Pectobacterium brasiliense]MBN3056029.1 hypothetical protein [Pectobacterium brasiliense]